MALCIHRPDKDGGKRNRESEDEFYTFWKNIRKEKESERYEDNEYEEKRIYGINDFTRK